MGNILRAIIIVLGTLFVVTVIRLLMKKKISEKNSLLWLFGSIAVFITSLNPLFLKRLARMIGVEYPPTLLFLFSTLVILFIALYHSIQISELSAQVKELTQYIALGEIGRERETLQQFLTEESIKGIGIEIKEEIKEEKQISMK